MFDKDGNLEVPYSRDDVFDAVLEGIPTMDGMKIIHSNKMRGNIQVSHGMTIWSFGENLDINLKNSNNGGTIISIHSTNKFGLDIFGSNKSNLQNVFNKIDDYLTNDPRLNANLPKKMEDAPQVKTGISADLNPVQKMEHLKQMLDNNFISQEEYDQKKKEILSAM